MKWRKAFEPKTAKSRPSKTRAMMMAIFMSGIVREFQCDAISERRNALLRIE